jgi:hypothetical protein
MGVGSEANNVPGPLRDKQRSTLAPNLFSLRRIPEHGWLSEATRSRNSQAPSIPRPWWRTSTITIQWSCGIAAWSSTGNRLLKSIFTIGNARAGPHYEAGPSAWCCDRLTQNTASVYCTSSPNAMKTTESERRPRMRSPHSGRHSHAKAGSARSFSVVSEPEPGMVCCPPRLWRGWG